MKKNNVHKYIWQILYTLRQKETLHTLSNIHNELVITPIKLKLILHHLSKIALIKELGPDQNTTTSLKWNLHSSK